MPLTDTQLRSLLADYRPRPLAGDASLVEMRPAGVLMPLIARGANGDWHVLLTQRTSHLTHHAGQISLPGGKVEPGDADAVAAALREAEEEVALMRDRVELIGQLDDYRTVTNYRITPVVGLVRDPGELRADPSEVEDIFEVPLAFFMSPGNFERHDHVVDGRQRSFYAVPYNGHFIWGATAAMLKKLSQVLSASS